MNRTRAKLGLFWLSLCPRWEPSVLAFPDRRSIRLCGRARTDGSVRFLVVVTTKSGQPVADLRQQDFTVFDDDVIRPIRSFRTTLAAKKQGGELYLHSSQYGKICPREPMAIGIFSTYEVIFDGAKSSGRRRFHQVGIKVDRPNLEVATRPGYLTSTY